MDDFEDKYDAIGKVISFSNGNRYLIVAGISIDYDYLLGIPTTEKGEMTVFIAGMDDNGGMLADIYKGKDYDDIYEVLWEKFTGIEDNDHNAGLTESDKTENDKTENTPADPQDRPEAQTIMSLQRTTSVKRTT